MLQTEWEYLLPKEKRRDDLLNGVPQIPIVCAEKVQREADPLFSLYFFFFFLFFSAQHMKSRLVLKATVYYMHIIKKRNPTFRHELLHIPKRTLTNPREPSKNNGYDNINDDYILRVKETISSSKEKYEILELMGQGTFGQVVQCRELSTNCYVAIKVIKRHRAFIISFIAK